MSYQLFVLNIKIEFENSVSNRNAKLEENCNFINSRRADWDHLPYFNEELALEKVDSFKQERIIKEDEEILILLGPGSKDIQQTVLYGLTNSLYILSEVDP